MTRFDYVQYDSIAANEQAKAKLAVQSVEMLIEQVAPGGSRPKHLALTKLEECYMWLGKLIRDEQISRNSTAPLQEERNDS